MSTGGAGPYDVGIPIADFPPASLDADVALSPSSTKEKSMKRVQQGFTLIELMIVVAIVGILAAIALPAYQDYVVRSKMSETEAAVAACKTSVAEYVSTHVTLPTTNDAAGCSTSGSQYVANGGGWDGTKIQYSSTATGASTECDLTLTPSVPTDSAISAWSGSNGSCPTKYVPSSFR
jgi:type IV pilus assembly protein PilA